MKAIQLHRFDGPEGLSLVDLPTPTPARGQILIRVHAAGINFFETLMLRNRYVMAFPLPAVLGAEVAGTVAALGEGVTGFEIGQRVAGALFASGNMSGGYAEYAVLDQSVVVPLPDHLSYADATALMIQGLTALFLARRTNPENKTVLVNAAVGGVGSFLLQLTRHYGAKTVIAAVGSDAKFGAAKSLGANASINYSQENWAQDVKTALGGAGPDIIYESVGGDITNTCLKLLSPEGHMVVYGALNARSFQMGTSELGGMIFGNQSLTGFALPGLLTLDGVKSGLNELFSLAASGDIKVNIGQTFPLEQAAEAHRAIESRTTTGKTVLTV